MTDAAATATAVAASTRGADAPASIPPRAERSEADLPCYTRSLLRIAVPVHVTLAAKKQPVGQIICLGPGSIIQFDKSCEEMLEVEVGGRTVALGEAVKVGDKFGVRLTSLVLPDERFVPVRR